VADIKNVNKKGFWTVSLLVMIILVLGCLTYFVLKDFDKLPKVSVGMNAIQLFDVYDEAENDLVYFDKSLEYSFSDSVNNLLENGGFFDINSKKQDNYVLWKQDLYECYPTKEKLYENLGLYLNKSVNSKLSKINYMFEYQFQISGDDKMSVIGIPNGKLIYNQILTNASVNYSVEPRLNLKVNYNFNEVLNKVDGVKTIVDKCQENAACWQQNAGFSWKNNGKFFSFELDIGKIGDVFGEKNLVLKGAVDFESSIGKPSLVC